MAWLARGDFTGSDFIQATDLNNLHADDVTWGGNVNGGGYTLSNVILAGVTTQGGTAGVSSFNTRTGAVVSQGGDYTAAMVGAVPTTLQILTPAGSGLSGGGPLTGNLSLSAAIVSFNTRVGAITLTPADITGAMGVVQARAINSGAGLQGGGNLSADRTLSVIPGDPTQQIQFLQSGAVVATRHAINFISGANVTVAVADNSGSGRVDVTVSSTGGGSGMVDPTTAKGDLIVRGPSITSKLAVGTDGQVLTADSTQSLGVKWGAASGGGTVATVFGRTGPAIVAAGGDYTAAQVTNAVDKSQTYSDPMWLTGLNWSKILSAPVILADPTTTKGDLLVRTSSLLTRLPVGGDGTILVADSAQSSGVRWGASPSAIPAGQFSGDMLLWKQTGGWGLISAAGQPAAVGNVLTVQSIGASTTLAWQAPPPPQATTYSVNGTQISAGTFGLNIVAGNNTAISGAIDSGNLRTTITITAGGPASGLADPTTTKGDLIARATAQVTRLPIGTDGTILMADSTQALGMKWAAVSGGGGGGAQTPWTSNIDAAGYTLSNVPVIQAPVPSGASANLILNAPGTLGSVSLQVDGTTMAAVNENGLTSWGAITAGVNALFPGGPPVVVIAGLSSSTWHLTGTANPTVPGTNTLTFQCMNQNAGVYCMNDLGYFGAGVAHPFYNLDAAGDCNITGVYRVAGAQLAAAQVVNAVSTLGSYADPVWITSLAYSKITGAPTAAFFQTPWATDIDAANHNLSNVKSIGIGTAIPIAALDVVGSIRATGPVSLTGGTGSAVEIGFNSSGPYGLISSWNRTAQTSAVLQIGGSAIILQSGGGPVGIGNAFPAYALDVNSGDINTTGVYRVKGVPIATNGQPQTPWASNIDGAAFNLGNVGKLGIGITLASVAYPFQIRVGLNQNLIIQSLSGNLGIQAVSDSLSAYVPLEYLASTHCFVNGNVGIGTNAPICLLSLGQTVTAHKLALYDNGSTYYGLGMDGAAIRYEAGSGGGHAFYANAGALQALTILSSGAVGVGIVPSAFPFIAHAASGANFAIGASSSGVSVQAVADAQTAYCPLAFEGTVINLGFSSAAKVGIQTNAPRSALSIITANPSTAATATQLTIGEASNNTGYQLSLGYYLDSTTSIYKGVIQSIHAAAGNALLLNPTGGNVGVGLTVPGNLLTLAGSGSTPSLRLGATNPAYFWDIGRENASTGDFVFNNANGGASVEKMRITTAGSVGVGKTPSYPLDVAGQINCTGGYLVNGVALATGGGPTTFAQPGKVANTVYSNGTGKPLYVSVAFNVASASSNIIAYVGGNPPGTPVAATGSGTGYASLFFIVLPGQFYQATTAGPTPTLSSWTEWN